MKLLEYEDFTEYCHDELKSNILKSAYSHLNNLHDPLRCNVFALILRELVRIIMSELAPDEVVKSTSWYSSETVTRYDRYRFAITGHISDEVISHYPQFESSRDSKAMVQLIKKLSKFAHISDETYELDDDRFKEFQNGVENTVMDYFTRLKTVNEKIQNTVWDLTEDAINKKLMEQIPLELEELSRNTIVEECNVMDLEAISCSIANLSIVGAGSVYVELNYGGRKDSLELYDSYPLKFKALVDSDNLEVTISSISVDTSSFYE